MKILIVDDEPIFVEQLFSIIQDYAALTTGEEHYIQTTYSATEALELMQEFQPDFILTDIKMTDMNGIEFSKVVQNQWPETVVVIISGFSSFQYAREALRANVADYLLKPIHPETVYQLLRQIESRVQTMKYRKLKEALQTIIESNATACRREIELVVSSYDYYSLFFIQASDSFIDPSVPHFHDLHEHRFVSNAREQSGIESIWVFLSPQRQGFVVIAGRRRNEKLTTDQLIRDITLYFSVEGIPLSMVYQLEIEAARLNPLIKEMSNALYARLIIGVPQIFHYADGESEAHWNEPGFQQVSETRIQLAISQKNWGALHRELIQLFQTWRQNQSPNILVENSIKTIIRSLCKITRQDAVTVKRLEIGAEEIVSTSCSFEEAATAIWDLFNHALKLDPETIETLGPGEDRFRQINAYLQANMHEPITVTQLCEMFGLSTTSLYNLFRNYGKASFIEYFSALRIQHAKWLMKQNPDMLTKDIAELVGYQDQHYFSRLFKNVTGMTPTEFRTSHDEITL